MLFSGEKGEIWGIRRKAMEKWRSQNKSGAGDVCRKRRCLTGFLIVLFEKSAGYDYIIQKNATL